MKKEFKIYDLCIIAVLSALGVVLSSFLQIHIFSDIRIDLSYIVIVYICYKYGGGWGALCSALIAGLESQLFTAYGFSLSWVSANLFIGLVVGTIFNFNKLNIKWLKHALNIVVIIISVAIGMLLIKSAIEIKLYSLTWAIKLPKNAIAFACDSIAMIIGYLAFLPR